MQIAFQKRIATDFILAMKKFMTEFVEDKRIPKDQGRDDKFNTSLPKIFDNLIVAFFVINPHLNPSTKKNFQT